MASVAGKLSLKIMTIAISIPVGIVTKKAVERVWSSTRPEGTLRDSDDAGVRWSDAIGWAVLSAAGVVIADLVSRKSAEEAYRTFIGLEPPAILSKAQKKALKKDEKAAASA